jgi:heat shock protein HtpX
MNRKRLATHKLSNLLQSVSLLGAMAALVALLGWLLAGADGVLWAVIIGALILWLSPRASPRLTLRLYGARELSRTEALGLYTLTDTLAEHAQLPVPPELYYAPTPAMNAFAIGHRRQPAIAVTDGLLRNLSERELAGVLAHEISHIRSNDIWVMTLADTVSRVTGGLAFLGQLLLFVNLPLLLFGVATISWWAILLLLFAPTISLLLQLALSRTREFDADIDAVEITGDPLGLASALRKLDRHQGSLWQRLFYPGSRARNSWILSTHPSSTERIRRLAELAETKGPSVSVPIGLRVADFFPLPNQTRSVRRSPWSWFGRLQH